MANIEAKYNLLSGKLLYRKQTFTHAAFNYNLNDIYYKENPAGMSDDVVLPSFPATVGTGSSFRFIVTNQLYGGTVLCDQIIADHPGGEISLSVGDNNQQADNLYIKAIHRSADFTDRVELFTKCLRVSKGSGDAFINREKITFQLSNRQLNFEQGALPVDAEVQIFHYHQYDGINWSLRAVRGDTGAVMPAGFVPSPATYNTGGICSYVVGESGVGGIRRLVIKVISGGDIAYYGTSGLDPSTGIANQDPYPPLVTIKDPTNSGYIAFDNLYYQKDMGLGTGRFGTETNTFNPTSPLNINYGSYNINITTDGGFTNVSSGIEEESFWTSASAQIKNSGTAPFEFLPNLVYGLPENIPLTYDHLGQKFIAAGGTKPFTLYLSDAIDTARIRYDLTGTVNSFIFNDNESLGGGLNIFPGYHGAINISAYDHYLRFLGNASTFIDGQPPVIIADISLSGAVSPFYINELFNGTVKPVFEASLTDADSGMESVWLDLRPVGEANWIISLPMSFISTDTYRRQMAYDDFLGLSGQIEYRVRGRDNAGNEAAGVINTLQINGSNVNDFKLSESLLSLGEPLIIKGLIKIGGASEIKAVLTKEASSLPPVEYNDFPPETYNEGWQKIVLPALTELGAYQLKLQVDQDTFNFSIYVVENKEENDEGICDFEKAAEVIAGSQPWLIKENERKLNYLRGIRDNVIAKLPGGQSFIKWYYQDLPKTTASRWLFADRERVELAWRATEEFIETAQSMERAYDYFENLKKESVQTALLQYELLSRKFNNLLDSTNKKVLLAVK